MPRRRIWGRALVASVLLSATISLAFAEDSDSKAVILSATPDTSVSPAQLTIAGKNLGNARPSLKLAGQPLAVASFTSAAVTADLPAGLSPGSYLLTLDPSGRGEKKAEFDVTLAASGPPATSDVYSVTAPALELRLFGQPVATLSLPAGSYWITFTSDLTNTTQPDPLIPDPTDTISCSLTGAATSVVRLGTDANQGIMSLQTVTTLNAPATIAAACAAPWLTSSSRRQRPCRQQRTHRPEGWNHPLTQHSLEPYAAMHHAVRHRLVALLLASSLLLMTGTVNAEPAAAPADATQHTVVLTPQVVHTGVEEYKSDIPLLEGDGPPCSADEGQVGYTHLTFVTLRDTYDNCVWQTAVRFDLGELSQYSEAIITKATLTYTDSVDTLLLPDGHAAATHTT